MKDFKYNEKEWKSISFIDMGKRYKRVAQNYYGFKYFTYNGNDYLYFEKPGNGQSNYMLITSKMNKLFKEKAHLILKDIISNTLKEAL